MRARSTLIVLAIFLALGAYIYFVERKQPTTEERSEVAKKLFVLELDTIESFLIERGGETVACEKRDGEWYLLKPVAAKADKSEVERILSRLQQAEVERRLKAVEGEPLEPADFGLDEPRVRLELRVKGEEASRELRIGAAAAAGGNVYCMVGTDDDVLLVRKGVHDALSSPVKDIRTKTVVELDTGVVDKLELRSGKKELAVARTGDQWRVTEPLVARADREKVEKLLDALKGLKVEEFISEDPAERSSYGLDEPSLAAAIREHDAVKTVLFGKSVEEEGQVYCTSTGADSIYAVKDGILEELDVSADDLRDRKILRISSREKLRSVEIISGDRKIVALARMGDEDWQITGPAAAKGDRQAVDELVDRLESIEVEDFVAEVEKTKRLKRYGLLEPALTVRVAEDTESGGEQRVTALLFGKKKKGSCYAKRSDEPSVMLVNADILGLANAGVLDFRSRQVFSFERDEAREVTVRRGEETVTVRRDGGSDWEVKEPAGREAEEAAVSSILWDLYDLRADAFVEEANSDALRRRGLSSPGLEVRVKAGEGEGARVYELSVGEEGEDGVIPAVAEGGEAGDFIFELPDYIVDDLERPLVREPGEE